MKSGVWFCDISWGRRECIERGEIVGPHILHLPKALGKIIEWL